MLKIRKRRNSHHQSDQSKVYCMFLAISLCPSSDAHQLIYRFNVINCSAILNPKHIPVSSDVKASVILLVF